MKIVRYKNQQSDKIFYGSIINGKIFNIKKSPFDTFLKIDKKKNIALKVKNLLPPCNPKTIIAFAINYLNSSKKKKIFYEPLIFIKSNNTICKQNNKIKIAFNSPTWGESELGIVIKKKAKNVSLKKAKEYILGYLPVNDITCNNIKNRDHHLARSKSADGYCPIGYYIDTDYNYKNKVIESYHNNILLRKGNTNDMIWKPEKIISWISTWMTLTPGDLVITGTPPRVRKRMYLKNGDTFTVKIEGFPKLENSFYESSK